MIPPNVVHALSLNCWLLQKREIEKREQCSQCTCNRVKKRKKDKPSCSKSSESWNKIVYSFVLVAYFLLPFCSGMVSFWAIITEFGLVYHQYKNVWSWLVLCVYSDLKVLWLGGGHCLWACVQGLTQYDTSLPCISRIKYVNEISMQYQVAKYNNNGTKTYEYYTENSYE